MSEPPRIDDVARRYAQHFFISPQPKEHEYWCAYEAYEEEMGYSDRSNHEIWLGYDFNSFAQHADYPPAALDKP